MYFKISNTVKLTIMTKNKFSFLAIVVIVFLFLGCSEDATPDLDAPGKDSSKERIISLTTTMPSEGTRIALEQNGKNVSLTWEEGDKIQLSFIQGDVKIKQVVEVQNISADQKKATFDIVIPKEIEGVFSLYGVYGGNGIDDADPAFAKLPVKSGDAQSLESIQEREDAMLYFTKRELTTTDNLDINITFKHLGSLFSITIKHTGNVPLENLKEARLISTMSGWAYIGGNFDLENEEFTDTDAAGNYISFSAEKSRLENGESTTFWGWFPSLPDEIWPSLNLQLLDNDGNSLVTSINTKETRTTPTLAGMSYYFYALLDSHNDNHNLLFTDSSYKVAVNPEIFAELVAQKTDLVASIQKNITDTIQAGLTYTEIEYLNKQNAPMAMFILTADLEQNISLRATAAANGENLNAKETVRKQVGYVVNRNYDVLAAVNGDFWRINATENDNTPMGQVYGAIYIDGVMKKDITRTASQYYFTAILNDGTFTIGDKTHYATSKNRIRESIGARYLLVRNGVNISNQISNKDIAPRTSVGKFNPSQVVFIVIDGRRSTHSQGVTMQELGVIYEAIGVNTAVNLDGGGSTTLFVKGENDQLILKNKPSDNTERSVANAWTIVYDQSKLPNLPYTPY